MSASSGEPLVIRSLEFIGGMAAVGGWRPEPTLPEIAFAGRSNVGKSSLLNDSIHRKKIRARQQHAGTHARDQLLQA